MSEDILQSWKNHRFIVADYELLDEPEIVVVLTDVKFWSENIDELISWCDFNGGKVKGMTVGFNNYEQLTLFTLRWS